MPDEQNGSEKKKAEEKKVTSAEDFITKAPLFVSIRVDRFSPPGQISFECDSDDCGKETTWYRVHDPLALGDRVASPVIVAGDTIKSGAHKWFKWRESS